MKKEEIRIYSPENIYEKGLLAIFKGMIKNVVDGRELAWQLFLRDFKGKYKQSLLGWIWLFLMPFVTMGTFLLLNISGVIRIGEIPVPYPIFGLLGISLWQLFSSGWGALTGSITAGGALVSKINFPKEALLLSSFGQTIVEFLIRLSLVLIVYLIYGLTPSIWLLTLPLFILPIILLTFALGFLTSLLNVIIRDTVSFISLGTSLFLFLMPIMYTMSKEGLLGQLNKYNPIFFLVNTPRDIIISGRINYPFEFILSTILALFIFFFSWFIFYISQSRLAERI